MDAVQTMCQSDEGFHFFFWSLRMVLSVAWALIPLQNEVLAHTSFESVVLQISEPSSAISILISSDFLKMDALVNFFLFHISAFILTCIESIVQSDEKQALVSHFSQVD